MLNPQGQELWLSFCVIENLSRPRNMFLYCSTVTFFWCHTSPQTAHLSSRFRPRGRLSQLLQTPCVAHRDTGIGSHGNVGTDPSSQAFTTGAAVNHFKTSEKWACMNLHQNWKLYEMSNSEMGTWIRQQGCLYPVLQLANISLQLNLHKSTWHPKLLPFAWLVLQFCSFLSFSTFETCCAWTAVCSPLADGAFDWNLCLSWQNCWWVSKSCGALEWTHVEQQVQNLPRHIAAKIPATLASNGEAHGSLPKL